MYNNTWRLFWLYFIGYSASIWGLTSSLHIQCQCTAIAFFKISPLLCFAEETYRESNKSKKTWRRLQNLIFICGWTVTLNNLMRQCKFGCLDALPLLMLCCKEDNSSRLLQNLWAAHLNSISVHRRVPIDYINNRTCVRSKKAFYGNVTLDRQLTDVWDRTAVLPSFARDSSSFWIWFSINSIATPNAITASSWNLGGIMILRSPIKVSDDYLHVMP